MSAADLLPLGTATLGEAWPGACILTAPPRPIAPGMALAGPALTVRCQPGDNLALHRAIAMAKGGEVLVVDYGGSVDSGPFGEIMALACQLRGIVGMVIDGSVRDSEQIAALRFPVFAKGLNIRGTTKRDRGQIGVPVTIGGVRVSPGDIVLADADAIVTLAPDDLAAALAASKARATREAVTMERLRQGETTLAILGLTDGDAP
ncbi:RraA family protein [Tabrizicola piscis]|uniref:Putative 4-hydroxy-4-methyl-2-oxoglutarate aldolase n=1 Tax=Tabrizicola piscis TaxID=2494374 RepID=A0A3S8U9F5_9RHOB|nr:RraA family protein [Tabrizicola piscis]